MIYLMVMAAAYVLGSIPFGLLVGKWWAKVDVRQYGSGNIGMTNVLRTAGYILRRLRLSAMCTVSKLIAQRFWRNPCCICWRLCHALPQLMLAWFQGRKACYYRRRCSLPS